MELGVPGLNPTVAHPDCRDDFELGLLPETYFLEFDVKFVCSMTEPHVIVVAGAVIMVVVVGRAGKHDSPRLNGTQLRTWKANPIQHRTGFDLMPILLIPSSRKATR